MLIFGDENIIKVRQNYDAIFNLSSLLEFGARLRNLAPPLHTIILPGETLDFRDEKTFDLKYAQYLMNSDAAFYDLMRLVYSLYSNSSIFVIISRSEYADIITESLIKFIQQRYGYNSNFIQESEDLDYLVESSFSVPGLYNLDIDKKRFVNMCAGNCDMNTLCQMFGVDLNGM
jgi:hypothetical protein